MLKRVKTLIVGFGISGRAAAAYLKGKGVDFLIFDQKGGEGIISDENQIIFDAIDQIILSPGIPRSHPILKRAGAIPVISELELGFKELSNRSFAITGSNGKTTTVTLTTHILNNAGKKARALGNVGEPICSYSLKRDPDEILIVELSSFQLEHLEMKKFEIGIVLNITPNHLDWHESFETYAKAKANIQKCSLETFISSQVFSQFGSLFFQHNFFEKEIALIKELKYTELDMVSKQSIQAAYLLCKRCGVTDIDFLQGLQSYKKAAHRIEWVAEINEVTYYNDSKSSNIHSVIHAVERMNSSIVLIVGGVHKGASYKAWVEPFQGKVRQIIAYGKAAPIVEYELSRHYPISTVDRFADAVKLAKLVARKYETVLLSPGCSSYDQFENYEQRGEAFKRLVREL